MLLAWLGERRSDDDWRCAAAAIEDALDRAIASPQWRTRDLGGPLGTKAFGERVAALVGEMARRAAGRMRSAALRQLAPRRSASVESRSGIRRLATRERRAAHSGAFACQFARIDTWARFRRA